MMLIKKDNFIRIEGGAYAVGLSREALDSCLGKLRGNTVKEEYLQNSFPVHTAGIEEIRISNCLVTCSEFKFFADETEYVTEAEHDGWGWVWGSGWFKRSGVNFRSPFGNNADDIYLRNMETVPALQLSWNDAESFCAWLSKNHKRDIRLPSEWEWEAFAGLMNVKGVSEIDLNKTGTGIGSPEDYITGIIEITDENSGNHVPGMLWEWCGNWFDIYPGGIANREFGEVYRALRGGSLLSHPVQRAREYRFRRCPTARSPYYGLRIALTD